MPATPNTEPAAQTDPPRLRRFVDAMSALLDARPDEAVVLRDGGALLADLVAHDDWLPDACAQSHPEFYQQYLLHADAAGRFSVVSFVWGPGHRTPIHDHTVWGLIGMLRGGEYSQPFRIADDGVPRPDGAPVLLAPGDVQALSPAAGDIHRVHNAHDDRVSVSIHVYGADIGTVSRSVFTETGERKPFISGYANRARDARDGIPGAQAT